MKLKSILSASILLLATTSTAYAVSFSMSTTEEADSWIDLQKFEFKTTTQLDNLLEVTFVPHKSCKKLVIHFEVENDGIRDGSTYLSVLDTRREKMQRTTMTTKVREGGLMKLVEMQCHGGEDGNKVSAHTLFYPARGAILPTGSQEVVGASAGTPPSVEGLPASELQKYDFSGRKASDSNVEIAIDQSILPGNPSYFPSAPGWGEYVVTAKIKSTLTIKSFQMVTSNGTFALPAQSAAELENPPGGGKKDTPLKSLAGLFKGKKVDSRKQDEFNKRVPSIGSTLDSKSVAKGSAFFPLSENPRAFVFEYTTTDSQTKQLRIDI